MALWNVDTRIFLAQASSTHAVPEDDANTA